MVPARPGRRETLESETPSGPVERLGERERAALLLLFQPGERDSESERLGEREREALSRAAPAARTPPHHALSCFPA
jgi:hypothetical protein